MYHRMLLRSSLVVMLLVGPLLAGDWPRFRGPNGTGVSSDTAPLPEKWSDTENLLWKTPLPGAGVSSPIIVGEKVFVTCYSGYGQSRNDLGDMEKLKRHLVCLDRKSGEILWDKEVKAYLPEDPFVGMGVPEHGYASHTPVSDGQRVYVYFGKSGAFAFDLEGNQIWQKSVGTGSDPREWGSSSSPILYKDLLIITASAESLAMVALNTEDGSEKWNQPADGLDGVWGTPVLVEVDNLRTDLVLGVPNEIWGFNPENGKLRWYCEGIQTDQFNSSLVANEGMIVGIEGRGGGSVALKSGGNGDVTKSNILWSGNHNNRFGTPVITKGKIYFINSGIANCIDAKTGDNVFQARLDGGNSPAPANGGGRQNPGGGRPGGRFGGGFGSDYASPIVADGKIFYTNRAGNMYVLKVSDKFEKLAVNRVTSDSEDFSASPSVSDGQLFFRSNKHLYCIGFPKK